MSYIKLEFKPRNYTYSKFNIYKYLHPDTCVNTFDYTGKDHYIKSNDFIITIKVNAKTYFERMHEQRLTILKQDYQKYIWNGTPTKLS